MSMPTTKFTIEIINEGYLITGTYEEIYFVRTLPLICSRLTGMIGEYWANRRALECHQEKNYDETSMNDFEISKRLDKCEKKRKGNE